MFFKSKFDISFFCQYISNYNRYSLFRIFLIFHFHPSLGFGSFSLGCSTFWIFCLNFSQYFYGKFVKFVLIHSLDFLSNCRVALDIFFSFCAFLTYASRETTYIAVYADILQNIYFFLLKAWLHVYVRIMRVSRLMFFFWRSSDICKTIRRRTSLLTIM